jgi:hypothetical protein
MGESRPIDSIQQHIDQMAKEIAVLGALVRRLGNDIEELIIQVRKPTPLRALEEIQAD